VRDRRRDRAARKRVIEVLGFDGCPNIEATIAFVERKLGESGVDAEVRRVDVADADAAARLRFLGSPSVRVDGCDIEPGADDRNEYVLACRVYRTNAGMSGQPDERWLRDALAR
jgi:hypothetical protein